MASVIWLGLRQQESLKSHLTNGGTINIPSTNPHDGYIRPVIAKGNIIEGIKAIT